jgi:hypothetical protein
VKRGNERLKWVVNREKVQNVGQLFPETIYQAIRPKSWISVSFKQSCILALVLIAIIKAQLNVGTKRNQLRLDLPNIMVG